MEDGAVKGKGKGKEGGEERRDGMGERGGGLLWLRWKRIITVVPCWN